jgi:GAF domain-containing protein
MNYENTRRGDNAAPPRVLSRSELEKQVTELAAQRAAISEVLRAIASSPHDLQPIFETILDSTTRLCRAELGVFRLVEKSGLRLVANNLSPAVLERYSPTMPVHIPDLAAHEVHRAGDAAAVALVKSGIRTSLLVPMLKNDELIGLLAIGRQRLERFTEKEIELVTDFAAQAATHEQSWR